MEGSRGPVAYDPQLSILPPVSLLIMCLKTQFGSHVGYETDYNLRISTNLLSFLWFVYKYDVFSS